MTDEHRINRDRVEREAAEDHVCPDCGAAFDTAARLTRHRDREKRAVFSGSAIGDAILERKASLERFG